MDIWSCKLAVPNLKNKIIMTEFIMSTSLLILVAIAAAVRIQKERKRKAKIKPPFTKSFLKKSLQCI